MEHEAIADAFWSVCSVTTNGASSHAEMDSCVHVLLFGISGHVHMPLIQAGTPSAAAGIVRIIHCFVRNHSGGIVRTLQPCFIRSEDTQ